MEDSEVSEGLNGWEQIQHPCPPQTCSTAQSREWDTVVIRDNYLSHHDCSDVFPPSNHEGLQITPQDHPNSSSSSSSPLSQGDGESRLRVRGEIGRRLRLRIGLLSSGILRIAYTVRSYAVCRGRFWSVASSAAGVVAALLMSVVYVRVRRWPRRLHQENKNRLILLIRERDEKISQLLLQIAQMNEILSAGRTVPVLRVG